MKIRYIGTDDQSDSHECTAFGHTFRRGEWVDLKDPPAKLLTNPTFEVEEKGRAKQAAA